MVNYKNDQVIIVGLGATGLSCVDFFLKRGANPIVVDSSKSPSGISQLPNHVQRQLGSLNKQLLQESTLIVTSPGVSLLHPALIAASKSGVSCVSDIEIFVREASAPIVAITGSNGKSTVTMMVSEMARSAGWSISVGGNTGLPALKLLDSPCQLYILELSSFQLEATYNLNAIAATMLNVSEDHMNRYPLGIKQYQAAKMKIYNGAKVCIFNADDELTIPVTKNHARCISFGKKYGDYYLHQISGQTWLMANGLPLIPCIELKFNGNHNYINALAALALADSLGIPKKSSIKALKNFCGLAHRFELVHERYGIKWINDSKATNVGSTIAALQTINVKRILHLLLGGDDKSADFTSLIPWLQNRHIKLYCFGKSGKNLALLKPDSAIVTKTLEQTIRIIGLLVKTGDVVLLSPACSSLDQFNNFEERGKVFTRLAREVG